MAAIVAACVVYVPPLIGWAQQTVDQEKLAILNDALNRHKCEGGNIQALTAGTPIRNVITRLQKPITWAGMSHQFLQGAFTVPARSLSAKGAGSSYRFTAYHNYTNETGGQYVGTQVRVYLTATGAGSWTVPSDWNSSANSIECIGGGGNGASANQGAGGGGAYSRANNLVLTPGATITYQIGAATQDTWFNGSSLGSCSCGAQGGSTGTASARGMGGSAAAGTGTVKYSGGNSGSYANGTYSPGGGGAAGPGGNGGNGGDGYGGHPYSGGGGGANGGGSDGASAANSLSGSGGNSISYGNQVATTGGTAVPITNPGFDGSNGSGGSGGNSDGAGQMHGGKGGNGTEWDASHGSGGGGGGESYGGAAFATGGLYGGGGGGRNFAAGAQGIIVITYQQ